jgi:lipopolysaccharide export system protein LptA
MTIFSLIIYPKKWLFPVLFIIFTVNFGVISSILWADQNRSRMELIHADVSRGYVENGIPYKLLEGNVHARQDTLEIFCNRAIYSEVEKILYLKGNIRMFRGRDTLLANEARYFEESQIALAEGNVQVYRPAQQMRSEYLEYHYITDQIRATGDVFLHDMDNRVFITAENGEFIPDKKYSYVREDSHLWRIDSTATDTLHIYSHQMEYHFSDIKRAIARDSVRIFQGNLNAVCDSAIYNVDEDIIFLKSRPEAIQENNQMLGEQMELILENRELREIHVTGNARAISTLDSILEKENRLEGRKLIMYIENRKLTRILAVSNARSFYYLREKEEDRGINVASADTIKAFLVADELDSIAVIGGAQGTYYPEDYQGKIIPE